MGEGCFIIATYEGNGVSRVKCACGNPKHVRTERRMPKRTIATIVCIVLFVGLTIVVNAASHLGITSSLEVCGFWTAVIFVLLAVVWFFNYLYSDADTFP